MNESKITQTKILTENEDLKTQCSQLKTHCQQLESERLPLIAQLEYADRNLRQMKKQQAAMTTSTTVQHPAPLQSIENNSTSSNNNKSLSRLIRSPSLDMRVMRRTSKI